MGMVEDIVSVKMARNLFGGFAIFMRMTMVGGRGGKHIVADFLCMGHGRATMRVPDTPSRRHCLKYRQQNNDDTKPSYANQALIPCFHRAHLVHPYSMVPRRSG